MSRIFTYLPLALEGEWADWRALVVVIISLVMLVGGIYMLLASNFGAYIGWLVLNVGFWGWMVMFSLIWLAGVPGTLPGTGPRTQEPQWIPFLAESEQGQVFTQEINAFPNGWDEPGKVYPGNIDSKGQIETLDHSVREALARLATEQGITTAVKAEDWDFRLPEDPVVTAVQRALPVGDIRFRQSDSLLARVEIPATDDHRAVTVYAYRDKGRTYLNALLFLIVSVLGLVLSTRLLARHEERQKQRQAAQVGTATP